MKRLTCLLFAALLAACTSTPETTLAPKADDVTKTSIQFFFDYNTRSMQTVNARIPYRFAGHKLMVGEGSYAEPNMQFEMDALRFSKGVLAPSQFLGRDRSGLPFVLIMR